MSNCIINFANGRYLRGQERLKESLAKHGYTGATMFYTSETQLGCPPHAANPYAFKTFAFMKAIEAGHKNILWVDSSVFAMRNLTPIFETIETEGYLMQEAGHMVGRWTNDNALRYYSISRDEAMRMPMYGNAGLLGLNTSSIVAMEFLERWHHASQSGLFIGGWNNNDKRESLDERCSGHRHDMSIGSILANKLGMKYKSGNDILHYAGKDIEPKEGVYFHAQGV